MQMQKLTFVSIAIVMAVAASVVAHREFLGRTPADNFPAAVTISSGSTHFGSGVILNKRWIITSAKCVENYAGPEELQVFYGSHDRNHSKRMHRNVEQILLHPKYEQERLVNNVALIKINSDIGFNETAQAATLPSSETEEDEPAYAIGWEKLKKSAAPLRAPEPLRYYETKVMALDLCWERLEDLDVIKVNDNVVCTYGPPEDARIILDHGSALVSMDKRELIGIGSWSERGYPIVYARIRSNLPWIETVIAT